MNSGRLMIVFEEIRRFVAGDDQDFTWSSWEDQAAALDEIDRIVVQLSQGHCPDRLQTLFAPTGPFQELALGNGWGDRFLNFADRFDEAFAASQTENFGSPRCVCFGSPLRKGILVADLGMDPHFASASVLQCGACGQNWLRVLIEDESFEKSGRWYLGPIDRSEEVAASDAREILEKAAWYFFGGSYYEGKVGRSWGTLR